MTTTDISFGTIIAGVEHPAWMRKARCLDADPEVFFPDKGGSTREAKRICNACEVQQACLEWALEHDERFGIWGGTSERERRRLRRERRRCHGDRAEGNAR